MIEAIRELGKYVFDNEDISEIDIFTINPSSRDQEGVIITIKLIEEDNSFKFDKVDFRDYSEDDYKLILYPPKVSKGISNSPICKITEVKKSFTNKILNYFKKDFVFLTDDERKIINAIYSCLEENKEDIISQISDYVEQYSKKDFRILTINIDNRNIIDNVLIKKIFLTLSKNKIGAIKENQSCACCSKIGDVYTSAFPLTFFTVDKPGFAYEFNQANTYKMLPLCYQCALELRLGVKFLRENLSHRLYYENYFIIPHFLNKINNKILKRITGMRNFATNKETKDQFEMDEGVILKEINKNLSNYVNFTLLFYQEKNAEFKIPCVIEDIFPSRFKEIFEFIDTVNSIKLFEKEFFRNPKLKFNFGTIRYFFPKSKNTKSDKYFFSVIYDIINSIKIDYNFLLQSFMKKIGESFREKKNHSVKEPVLKSILFLMFLERMDLLKNISEGSLMQDEYETKSEFIKSIRKFFEDNKICYNSNEKIVAFLVGCLVNNVIYEQNKALNSSPFSQRLKGLKLDLRSLKSLFNESIAKLEQYKQKKLNEPLIQEIANYFSKTDSDKWKISNMDINFFVAQGLSLAKQFIPIKQTEENKND